MRRLSIFLIAIVSVGLICACTSKKDDTIGGGTSPVAVDASDVFKTMKDNLGTFKVFPGTTEMMPGRSPHGAFVTIMVNDVAMKSIEGKKAVFDYGSMIIKKNYGKDKTFGAYTVMYKVKGYYPAGGDWYWAKFDENGASDLEGKTIIMMYEERNMGCIVCHVQVKDNDWAFSQWPR